MTPLPGSLSTVMSPEHLAGPRRSAGRSVPPICVVGGESRRERLEKPAHLPINALHVAHRKSHVISPSLVTIHDHLDGGAVGEGLLALLSGLNKPRSLVKSVCIRPKSRQNEFSRFWFFLADGCLLGFYQHIPECFAIRSVSPAVFEMSSTSLMSDNGCLPGDGSFKIDEVTLPQISAFDQHLL